METRKIDQLITTTCAIVVAASLIAIAIVVSTGPIVLIAPFIAFAVVAAAVAMSIRIGDVLVTRSNRAHEARYVRVSRYINNGGER